MKLFCKDCKKERQTIIKMGGLICSTCRLILKGPHEWEWVEVFRAQKKEEPKPKLILQTKKKEWI